MSATIKKIRDVMTRKGITRKALSSAIGVSKSRLDMALGGFIAPKSEELEAWMAGVENFGKK